MDARVAVLLTEEEKRTIDAAIAALKQPGDRPKVSTWMRVVALSEAKKILAMVDKQEKGGK